MTPSQTPTQQPETLTGLSLSWDRAQGGVYLLDSGYGCVHDEKPDPISMRGCTVSRSTHAIPASHSLTSTGASLQ